MLSDALSLLSAEIEVAVVYGSMASGKAVSSSDIDLLIIGKIEFSQVVKCLQKSEEMLVREVNPKILSGKEWDALKKKEQVFYKEVMQKPKLYVIGSEHGLG